MILPRNKEIQGTDNFFRLPNVFEDELIFNNNAEECFILLHVASTIPVKNFRKLIRHKNAREKERVCVCVREKVYV